MSPARVDMRGLAMHGLALALDAQRLADGDLNPEVALDAARRRFARLDISDRAVETLARGLLGREGTP